MPNQSVIFFRCPTKNEWDTRLLESSHTVIAIVQLLWLLTKIQQIWLLENFTYATQPQNMWMISLFLLQPLQCNNMFNVTNILNQYHRNHKRSYIKRAHAQDWLLASPRSQLWYMIHSRRTTLGFFFSIASQRSRARTLFRWQQTLLLPSCTSVVMLDTGQLLRRRFVEWGKRLQTQEGQIWKCLGY